MLPNTTSGGTSATQSPPVASNTKNNLSAEDAEATGGDELGEALSPMRTHEQSGHASSIADKYAHLVEESDDEEQAVDVNKVDHEAMKRKELTRQKTSEGGKQNRMRDRLKRTVSKQAE